MKSIETHIENYSKTDGDRGDGLDQSRLVKKTTENENIQIDLASGEPEGNRSCVPNSSETFIISSNVDIDPIILRKETRHSSWLKTYWFSVTMLSSLLITLMIVLTMILIYT